LIDKRFKKRLIYEIIKDDLDRCEVLVIPENITREHIIKAIEEIDKSEVPSERDSEYSIKISEGVGRAHLSFPSGTIVHVRGSIILKDERGFYYLQEEDQKDIVENDRRFLAAVFGNPEKTFVFPKEARKTLFGSYPLTLQEGKKTKMVFRHTAGE
jgi:hypothetical protein